MDPATISSMASLAGGGGLPQPINPWAIASVLPQVGLGVYQTIQSRKGLKNLQNQALPNYSVSPEMQAYYNVVQQRSNMGYTPQETAAFKQNVAQQQNTGFNQAVNMSGGNLAQAINTGLKAQNIGAMNQFAAQDASLHRQNIAQWGQAANQMQGQKNLIDQQKIQRRNMLEQAYGQAMQQGLSNVASGLTSGLGMMAGQKGGGMGYSSQQQYNPSNQQINSGQYIVNPDWDPTLKDFAPGGMFYNG